MMVASHTTWSWEAAVAEADAKKAREEAERARDAERFRRARAEGRLTFVPPLDPSAPVAPRKVASANGAFVKDDVYWKRLDQLQSEGLEMDFAHPMAVARSKSDAELRAIGIEPRDRLPRTSPAPRGRPVAGNDNEKPPKIKASSFVLSDPTTLSRREWLLGKFALRKEISMTVAPGGVGKTALSHAEAISLASGRSFLGFDVPAPLRVWIWNGEEPMEEMKRRIGAICLHHDVSADDLGDRLFVDTEDDVKFVLCVQDRTKAEVVVPVVDSLVAELKRRKIDVMIVDPFVSTHNCTENDNGAMHVAASAWKTVAKQANCAVHLVHHTRKSNGQVITSESLRGATPSPQRPAWSGRSTLSAQRTPRVATSRRGRPPASFGTTPAAVR